MFYFSIAKEIDHENDDPDPIFVSECQIMTDWEKCQVAMKNEIFSLNKQIVCIPIIITPKDVMPVRYK